MRRRHRLAEIHSGFGEAASMGVDAMSESMSQRQKDENRIVRLLDALHRIAERAERPA